MRAGGEQDVVEAERSLLVLELNADGLFVDDSDTLFARLAGQGGALADEETDFALSG